MKALLLIAHGSRREASNDEVRELAKALAEQAGSAFDRVVPAFLELAEPSIPDGVAECVRRGATEVVAVPYFLSAGRHVAHDIPEELEKASQANPEATVTISPYLGQHPGIAEMLLGLARQEEAAPDVA